jgi:hypothetical protein
MTMNIRVITTSEQSSDAFEHLRCGKNLVCCILCALLKSFSDVNIVGANHIPLSEVSLCLMYKMGGQMA